MQRQPQVAEFDSQSVCLPPSQDVLSSIRQRLERAVTGTRLPPWPPTATAASRRATVFLARRFGKALRLLHNVLAFDGVLPRRYTAPTLCGVLATVLT